MPEQLEETRADKSSETPEASSAETSGTTEAAAAESSTVEVAAEVTEQVAKAVEDASKEAAATVEAAAGAAADAVAEGAKTATAEVEKAVDALVEKMPDSPAEAVEVVADQAAAAATTAAETVAAAIAQVTEAVADTADKVAAKADSTTATAAIVTPAPAAEPAAEKPAGKTATAEVPVAEKPAAESAKDGAKAVPENPSERTLRQQETMTELTKAKEEKTPVEGRVIGWNKGGYHVAIGEIAAFCPVSQIEIGNPRSPKRYLEKEFSFHVIEIEKGGRRVVLSRADALKTARKRRASQVREKLEQGATLEGKVSSITDFGAFVSLGGGIEGLVHVSEISRRRVEHANELLKTGQRVKVQVIKIENGGKRIGLSMKRLEKDPWKGADERYKMGDEFKGTILRKTDFGLFVEVEPGLEGLVHSSRLLLGMTINSDELEVGKEITGWVQECSPKRRRLSLSMRPVAQTDPWVGVADRYEVGSVVKGTVERLAAFGAFIEVEPGLTGLLPFSEVSLSPGSNPKRQFHAGKEVTVQVLTVEPSRRRMSLGTETSKAEGTPADFKDFKKQSQAGSDTGLSAMAAAFAKLKSD